MNKLATALIMSVLFAGSASAMPKEGCGGNCAGCHSLSVKEANTLVKGLGGRVTQVKFPAMRGVWELDMEKDGKKGVAYVDYGKKHIIPGPIFSLATKKPIGGGAAPQAAVTKVNPALLTPGNSIILGNPQGKKRLFVFTDPDCPFCAKLHGELKKLVAMDRSVAVYVKLFPLKIHPTAYDKSRVIMQGPSAKLLDDAFAKVALPAPGPNTPRAGVDENIRLAAKLGVNSTPTLIFSDGRLLAGARTAAEIQALFNGKKTNR
ncbi:DsbC family protein [Geotalea sp. SG265]|uniref:DsbC family protein n=1 Tax=Geotalea sp. SG265 TaxID=2922867 RepID=UPI001FB003F2|nr:DsbC family protein [Geotalea sp. SG265]